MRHERSFGEVCIRRRLTVTLAWLLVGWFVVAAIGHALMSTACVDSGLPMAGDTAACTERDRSIIRSVSVAVLLILFGLPPLAWNGYLPFSRAPAPVARIDRSEGEVPSKGRRGLAIVAYCMVVFVVLAGAQRAVLSLACDTPGPCGPDNRYVFRATGFATLALLAAVIVAGGRGRLPGARRRTAAQTPTRSSP